ncbi:2-oxo-4-hydroxy-4-carboxy-5-ureidoimidazoline decarboxylase [Nocardioides nematodiphilus]|uniref:2-oxo-4-hydroxy-4-carboxy-5-ureidoimidazoline decarboxylase n=1 Tax=Nocardioides nematodiphilus TaxID=2849669 RepID=UPI001CD9D634|nr:2-oxo-4-hydroxy-4-carboxy-5-ureidoimidazoline decarboxylase [Nocardioides nematodiphilus]MCA1982875.1 2-oxo-4-hydroxy-4-carboxy-5-ureidoimidazoline decarboxylase [Nocardioides nematodiphilus]
MDLATFNRLDAAQATELLAPCVRIASWPADIVAARPYPDTAALLQRARDAAAAWTDAEVEAALADHPRIGERPSGDTASAVMSTREQAGVDPADSEVQQRLRHGNARYEARFGRIYLVRAAGRSADELLDLLEERLDNDPDTERAVTKQQLGEIALLRLEGLIPRA